MVCLLLPGRPKQMTIEEATGEKRKCWECERYRIPIGGKFGQRRRRFGLDRILSKLAITGGSTISIIFLVMNLEKLLRDFRLFLSSLRIVEEMRNWLYGFGLLPRYSFSMCSIKNSHIWSGEYWSNRRIILV